MRAKWTDLAVEAAGGELREGGLSRTVVKVEDEASARRLGRPMGTYVTLACEQALTVSLETRRALAAELAKTLRGMLPEDMKTALVVGLGNRSVTPDSLGPRTAERVLVTRHIGDSLPWGAEMNSVCAAAPGVLGVTGMETAEILRGMVAHVRPDAVIAVDALASRRCERVCTTVQLSDTGIVPGSGVGNARAALQKRTLGVPVFCLGVPTVLDAGTLGGPRGMIVTPRDIDAQVRFLGRVAADAVNLALHPEISYDDFAQFIPNR